MKRQSSPEKAGGAVAGVLLVAVLAAAAIWSTFGDLQRLRCATGAYAMRDVEYKFGAPAAAGSPVVIVTRGCAEDAAGISVPPHGNCEVDLWLTRNPGERGRILLKVLRPEGVTNDLVIRANESGAIVSEWRDVIVTDEMDLPVRPHGSLSVPEVVLTAANQSASPAKLVYGARYATFADATPCLVDFRRLFAAFGAVLFAALSVRRVRLTPVAVTAVPMLASSFAMTSTAGFWIAMAIVLAVAYQSTKRIEGDVRDVVRATAAIWAIGLLFVWLRYPYLAAAVNKQLDPDAAAYRLYAEGMSLFSQNGFFSGRFSEREPLYVLVAHVVFKLFGASDLHLRYASFLSALPIPFLTYAMTRLSGARRVASAVAALLVTIASPYLLELPSRGLRDDLFITTTAVFILALLVAVKRQSNLIWMLVAAAGVVCMWTRTPTLVFALALFVWFWIEGFLHRGHLDLLGWVRRWRIWEGVLCLALIYVSFLPIRMAWKRIYGHSDYPERGYARWNANVEFAERAGTPGFPTREELQRTPYNGPPMTMTEYLFGLHTPAQLLFGSVRGTFKTIRDLLPQIPDLGRWFNRAFGAVFILLLIGSFFFARSRLVTMAALSSLSYAAFFYDRGLVELRSAAHTLLPLSAAALLTLDLGLRSRVLRKPDAFRASVRDAWDRATPGMSAVKAIAAIAFVAVVTAAAVILRNPDLPPSPNARCLALAGFYWKAAAFMPFALATLLPLLCVAIVLGLAIVAGVRWWAAIAVAAFAVLAGFAIASPEFFTGPTPRTYLWKRGDTIEHTMPLRPSMRGKPARLRFYVREPFRSIASPFVYRIEIDDQPVATVKSLADCEGCVGFQWREIAVPAGLLTKDSVTARFRVITDGDQSMNYVEVGRVPFWRMGASRWNGNADDLSPDPGLQRGTLMVGLSFGVDDLWLGR